MQTATPPDVQTAPPQPPQDKPANGAGSPEHLAALPTTELLHQNEELARNWAAVQKIGRMVASKSAEVSKQNTECAKIKANLDDEREKLHKLEREQKELQEELTLLATGRQSERLPFRDELSTSDNKATAPAGGGSADDWKSVTLEMLGIKTKRVLSALHDHEPPIVTFGDLAAWQQKKGDFWAKDIKKLGEKGREEIENATSAYWLKHPQTEKEDATADYIPGRDLEPGSIMTFTDGKDTLRIRVGKRDTGKWAWVYDYRIDNQAVGRSNPEGNFATYDKAVTDATQNLIDHLQQRLDEPLLSKDQKSDIRDHIKRLARPLEWTRIAEASRKDESFDDAAILPGTEETIVNHPGNPLILQIKVAQRKSGRWAAKYGCSIAGSKKVPAISTKDQYVGDYRNRAEAVVWACDEIDTFVKATLNAKPNKKVREAAKEARRIIDRIDKQIAAQGPEAAQIVAEGLPDPKAQGEHDAAVTEKDNTAKRGRGNK